MTPANCELCGLPLRYGTITHTVDDQPFYFCCQGCRMVYTMLLESDEVEDPAHFRQSDLFRQCVAAGVIPASEADLKSLHAGANTPVPAPPPDKEHPDTVSSETLDIDLRVVGMWCPACAWVIENALSRMEGVKQATCYFSTDRLRCRYRPERTDPEQIRQTVSRLGYTVHDADTDRVGQSTYRRELIRLVISGLFSANVMMLSWALYAGFFTELTGDAVSKISLPIVFMATAVFVYGGGPMLRKAWYGIVHLAPGMETLVGLAAGCAYFYSLFNWLTGSIHLYFDTACMLITLVLLGKLLEQRAKNRVRQDLEAFFALQPGKVRIVTDKWPRGRFAAIEQLAVGDQFAVETGEIVPADGRVVSGRASIDESALTGEARPATVQNGQAVKSGTRLVGGRVTVTADSIGDETVLGQMITIMRRGLEQKDAFEGRTDRILHGFVPVIISLAILTGLAWYLAGLPLNQAMIRGITVMVISCPCALGVAIPMARLAGVSMAGKQGILVRDIEAFERAGAVDSIVFDKTGTLTHGRWEMTGVDTRPDVAPSTVIGWAAGLERSADHEIGRAITAHATRHDIPAAMVSDVCIHPNGITGRVDDRPIKIGGRGLVQAETVRGADRAEKKTGRPTSRVFLEVDGQWAATLYFGDRLRPAVPALIQTLKETFGDIAIVSGDDEVVTRRLAEEIGIAIANGNLLPTDKAAFIDALTAKGRRPAMVGDGINDAAAMGRAHLSVAIHNGQPLAAEAAHLTLMRGDPAQLPALFELSRRINRKVTQNLWCAWIYNLVGIPVAMSGLLTPLVAAAAMLLSSLTVIGNTLLLVRQHQ